MGTPTEYSMSGCKVKFPMKAYPSQVAMMSKIITSLQRSQNSLLESPTGSGKSLALLCATLAWQEAEQKRVDEFNSLLAVASNNQDSATRDALMALAGPGGVEYEDEPAPLSAADLETAAVELARIESLRGVAGGGFIPDEQDPEDEDFREPLAKRVRMSPTVGVGAPPMILAGNSEEPLLKLPKRQKVPKIYFGTRTHKQVAQIVRELRKTAYSSVRMAVLGSREHTCIHPTISRSYNKNQDCQELMDRKKGGGCRFQANVKAKLASHHSLRQHMGHSQAWDLEDLVKVGRKIKACPYYATRELKNAAQLIICPYNYLVDPRIRKSMEISVKNQVIVLDEAHNIEDSAREAVSGSFDIDDIAIAMKEFERMAECQVLVTVHQELADFCSRLAGWLQAATNRSPDYSDFTSSSKVWTGTTGLAEWNEMVFPPLSFGRLKELLQQAVAEQAAAIEEENTGFDEGNRPVLSRKASDLLDGILSLVDTMYLRDAVYRDDYRISVVSSQVRRRKKADAAGGGWLEKGKVGGALVKTVTLNFWCLNPAVCFDELKTTCRSIVLTSGTLSPLDTFASELDARFPVMLEANHVIDRRQVWVGTLSHGPTGVNLNATYRNTETLAFQDEIGKLMLGICQTVPHGILLFLPSYKMLDTLCSRWQITGTWAAILQRKTIVVEPRGSDLLDGVMKEFYAAVENNICKDGDADGALFIAVCRGKVSEGLDFADNNARAVVCVGIPFPNIKDTLVELKRKYNDHKRSTRDPNILSGGDWYEIQAFRALNQALGRCIRHRKDWGAILMVDDRYGKNDRYVKKLSKWVRGNITHYNNTSAMLSTLTDFTREMKSLEDEAEFLSATQTEPDTSTREKDTQFKRNQGKSMKEEEEETAGELLAPLGPNSAWPSPQLAASRAKLQEIRLDVSKSLTSSCSSQKQLSQLDIATHLDTRTHLNWGQSADVVKPCNTNSSHQPFGDGGKSSENGAPSSPVRKVRKERKDKQISKYFGGQETEAVPALSNNPTENDIQTTEPTENTRTAKGRNVDGKIRENNTLDGKLCEGHNGDGRKIRENEAKGGSSFGTVVNTHLQDGLETVSHIKEAAILPELLRDEASEQKLRDLKSGFATTKVGILNDIFGGEEDSVGGESQDLWQQFSSTSKLDRPSRCGVLISKGANTNNASESILKYSRLEQLTDERNVALEQILSRRVGANRSLNRSTATAPAAEVTVEPEVVPATPDKGGLSDEDLLFPSDEENLPTVRSARFSARKPLFSVSMNASGCSKASDKNPLDAGEDIVLTKKVVSKRSSAQKIKPNKSRPTVNVFDSDDDFL